MNKIRKEKSLKQKAYLVFFYLPLLTLFSLILTSSLSFAAMDSSTKQIEGVICFPDYERKECLIKMLRNKWEGFKDNLKNIWHEVGCSVNTASREFADHAVDLSVKVPGGRISIERLFYGNQRAGVKS